jgi:hypothetical protein
VIGELCFFGEVSPLFGTLRTAAARVKRDCVLFQIASHDFLEVLKDFPRASKALKKVALERLNRVQAYRHPDPDDVDELAKDDDIDTQDARVAKKENDQSDSGIVDKNHGGSITVATQILPAGRESCSSYCQTSIATEPHCRRLGSTVANILSTL